jgi:hypothetical protein
MTYAYDSGPQRRLVLARPDLPSITLAVDSALYEAVLAVAPQRGLELAAVMRRALREALERRPVIEEPPP